MLNLSVLLTDAARETPDRDAVVLGDPRLSYATIDTISSQVANLLVARGIGRGDKVAIASPNLPYFPMIYFGILKAGIEGEGPGEIAIRGHNIMKGYCGRPEATAEVIKDGWFRTGDLAKRDGEGYYYIVEHSKDMIIRGGFNVYPRELEEVLMTHPAVSLVAVVGVPHDSHDEEVKAYVIRTPGDTTTEDELIAWGKENFASYKYPRIVEFRDALPMTATGKILKRELR